MTAWANQMPGAQGDELCILLWYCRCHQSGGAFSNLLTVISLPLDCALKLKDWFCRFIHNLDDFATCRVFACPSCFCLIIMKHYKRPGNWGGIVKHYQWDSISDHY